MDGKTIITFESSTFATAYQIYVANVSAIPDVKAVIHRSDYPIWVHVPSRVSNTSYKAEFANVTISSSTFFTVEFLYGTSWSSSIFDKIYITCYYTKTTD